MNHQSMRKVIPVGASVAVTMPPPFGLKRGDYVSLKCDGESVTIYKLKNKFIEERLIKERDGEK